MIGEAVKNLSSGLRDRHRDVPWTRIAGMRNVLIHEYFGVRIETVWAAVENRLPELNGTRTSCSSTNGTEAHHYSLRVHRRMREFGYRCEHCEGTVWLKRVRQEAFKHKLRFLILEGVTIGVRDSAVAPWFESKRPHRSPRPWGRGIAGSGYGVQGEELDPGRVVAGHRDLHASGGDAMELAEAVYGLTKTVVENLRNRDLPYPVPEPGTPSKAEGRWFESRMRETVGSGRPIPRPTGGVPDRLLDRRSRSDRLGGQSRAPERCLPIKGRPAHGGPEDLEALERRGRLRGDPVFPGPRALITDWGHLDRPVAYFRRPPLQPSSLEMMPSWRTCAREGSHHPATHARRRSAEGPLGRRRVGERAPELLMGKSCRCRRDSCRSARRCR